MIDIVDDKDISAESGEKLVSEQAGEVSNESSIDQPWSTDPEIQAIVTGAIERTETLVRDLRSLAKGLAQPDSDVSQIELRVVERLLESFSGTGELNIAQITELADKVFERAMSEGELADTAADVAWFESIIEAIQKK